MGDEVTECDEVWDQLSSEMPELYRRYAISAVVRLRWSNVSFVIRRGTDDLQALVNRVGCAWRAKDQGKLDTFEFAIEVTLNMDLTLKK